eukprot:9063770-Karenia_brevis.AAC.1
MPTWYRNLRKDRPDVGKGESKLDTCEDCMHWDHSLEPMIKESMRSYHQELESCWPGYWTRWNDEILPTLLKAHKRC